MQTLAWSPGMRQAVRTFKRLDGSKLEQVMQNRTFMESFSLSPVEEKTLLRVFKNQTGAVVESQWM